MRGCFASVYHVVRIRIPKGDPWYEWCSNVTHRANDMQNCAYYIWRNVYTALHKQPEDRHPNEQAVLDSIQQALPNMKSKKGKPHQMPTLGNLPDSTFLDAYFRAIKHPAYYADGFSSQTAQHAIDRSYQDIQNFWDSLKAWQENPEKFTGKPNLPHYKHKGGMSTTTITNQDADIKTYWRNGQQRHALKLPKAPKAPDGTKEPTGRANTLWLDLGRMSLPGRLQEAQIIPSHEEFVISLTMDDGKEAPAPVAQPRRIGWIDPGVNWIVAAVSNCGAPCLLISGDPLKAANQSCDKRIARIQSEQTRGGDGKFRMTDEAHAVLRYREDYVRDFLSKVVARTVSWCVDNRIDTLGVNYNQGWKQDCPHGKMCHENQQAFHQFPFDMFLKMLELKCVSIGVRFERHEESYTSQASFLDEDYIPSFGCDDAKGWVSSGRRVKRGLFWSSDGRTIHADLNGAANGLRKHYTDAFSWADACEPNFDNMVILRHPDFEFQLRNRMKQRVAHDYSTISHSKQHRLNRKKLENTVLRT